MAQAEITPPVGIYHRNWGAASHDQAEGVDTPLMLTVLALRETPEEPPLVLAGADLGWWRDPKDETDLRQAVLDTLALDPSRFLLNFSHTHAGPVLCRADGSQPGGEHINVYLDFLRDTLIGTILRALHDARPRTLRFTYGVSDLATQRDLPHPDGSGRYLCGWNPEGKADRTLLVGGVFEEQNPSLCCASLLNYACHPTVLGPGNRLLSPDFVGEMRVGLQRIVGGPCLFLQGASGELAPRVQYQSDLQKAKFAGFQLGSAALASLANLHETESVYTFAGTLESGAPLALWETSLPTYPSRLRARLVPVELPLKPEWRGETPEEQAWAASENPALRERLRRRLRIRLALGGGPMATMPLWVWQIGEAFLIAQPNEAYSALQTEVRAAFPKTTVIVLNVTNGWFGYLPPADVYDTDRYSVWQTPFAAGSLEILIQTAIDTICEMRDTT